MRHFNHIYADVPVVDAHNLHLFRFLGVPRSRCTQLAAKNGFLFIAIRVGIGVVFRGGEVKFGDLAGRVGGIEKSAVELYQCECRLNYSCCCWSG